MLDQIFETSSMMHYHVREEIFVVVNRVRYPMVACYHHIIVTASFFLLSYHDWCKGLAAAGVLSL